MDSKLAILYVTVSFMPCRSGDAMEVDGEENKKESRGDVEKRHHRELRQLNKQVKLLRQEK